MTAYTHCVVRPDPATPGRFVETEVEADADFVAQREAEEAAWAAGLVRDRPDQIASRRYDAEIGGTLFGGWPVATDRDSQAKINAAYTLARDGYWSGGWKFADGVYRPLLAEQVVAMALAVSAHVQACFAHEAALLADPEADINVGWPA